MSKQLLPLCAALALGTLATPALAQDNFFAGREQAVELAMRSIKVTPPRPAGR